MTTIPRTRRLSPFVVFRRRSFSLLWSAQFISQLGNGLTSVAAIVLVYQITGSALSVGLMLIATALPSLLVGLIAGRFAFGWAFALDALWFVLSAACIVGVRVSPAAAEQSSAPMNIVHDLRAGLRFVRDTAILRSLLITCCVLFLGFGLLNAL